MTAKPIPAFRWLSRAQVIGVHDGDTITVRSDRGLDQFHDPMRLRLLDVWAPEVTGVERPAGLASRAYVEQWLADAEAHGGKWPLLVETFVLRDRPLKTFDRFVAMVWRVSDGAHLNTDIVSAGFAQPFRMALEGRDE